MTAFDLDTAPEALERLGHLVETLNSSIALGRRIVEDLRRLRSDQMRPAESTA